MRTCVLILLRKGHPFFMRAQIQDMTTGKLSRQIFLFSVPLILSNLLQVLLPYSFRQGWSI